MGGLVPQSVILRVLDGELAWYPPGGDGAGQPLASDEAMAALIATLEGQRSAACFALPGEAVRLLELDIEEDERRHIERSLPFMLEEQLAEDVDDLHFASTPLERLRYGVAVTARSQMEAWQAALAGVEGVNAWVPEALLLPWRDEHWCLVLENSRAILRCGQAQGFSVESDLLPAMLNAQIAEGGLPPAIVVYGNDQARDLEHLPEELRAVAQWFRGGFCEALMLAGDESETLNLRQGAYAPQLPLGRWWQQWQAVAAVFAAAFLLQMLAAWLDYRQLEQENIALRTAVQDSYRQANPRGAVVDPEKQLRRQLESLRGTGQSSGFVSLMDRVGAVIAKQKGTAISSINYSERGGEMRLNILASDFEAVEAIREGINRSGLQAEMESSSARDDGVRARIRVGEAS